MPAGMFSRNAKVKDSSLCGACRIASSFLAGERLAVFEHRGLNQSILKECSDQIRKNSERACGLRTCAEPSPPDGVGVQLYSGSSSGVEHQLPKLRVAGSNPVSRSARRADEMVRRTQRYALRIPRWAVSSAGLERLPYKQEVTGSNPVPPTKQEYVHRIPSFPR